MGTIIDLRVKAASIRAQSPCIVGCCVLGTCCVMLRAQGVADANSNAIIGHGLSFLVGRVSYTFGLQVRTQTDAQYPPWDHPHLLAVEQHRIDNVCPGMLSNAAMYDA